jgi:hypothetical protein
MEYGTIRLITRNKRTACLYWFRDRQKPYPEGDRPDIYKVTVGKWGMFEHLSDEEIQDEVNKIASMRRSQDEIKKFLIEEKLL